MAQAAIAEAHRTAVLSVGLNTLTLVTLQAAPLDQLGAWAAGTPTRLTAPSGGDYLVGASTEWAQTVAGSWASGLFVRRNGAGTYLTQSRRAATLEKRLRDSVARAVTLAAGEYVELLVLITGATTNLDAASLYLVRL